MKWIHIKRVERDNRICFVYTGLDEDGNLHKYITKTKWNGFIRMEQGNWRVEYFDKNGDEVFIYTKGRDPAFDWY